MLDGIQLLYGNSPPVSRAYFQGIRIGFREFNILTDENLKCTTIGAAFTLGFHGEWPGITTVDRGRISRHSIPPSDRLVRIRWETDFYFLFLAKLNIVQGQFLFRGFLKGNHGGIGTTTHRENVLIF